VQEQPLDRITGCTPGPVRFCLDPDIVTSAAMATAIALTLS
jgi:hypothetical protein